MEHSNFDFLKEHDPLFFQLANSAEHYFARDPNTALMKLRQFGEALAQNLAVRYHIDLKYHQSQVDLINALDQAMGLDRTVRSLFHQLRIKGNQATHEFETKHQSALEAMRIARQLAIWYHRAFGSEGRGFIPADFVEPKDPSQSLKTLQREINRLQNQIRAKENTLEDQQKALENSEELARLHAKEKAEHQRIAEMMDDLAREQEEEFKTQQIAYEARLKELELALGEQNQDERRRYRQALINRLFESSAELSLDEVDVRIILDHALRDAAWEADSKTLNYAAGARPEVGKNRAIANWPIPQSLVKSGVESVERLGGIRESIDYLLFCGVTPIAMIEAKGDRIDVAGKIEEAIRHASRFPIDESLIAPWIQSCRGLPWRNESEIYTIPFVYSANGRPYLDDYPERSGIWFQDLRHPSFLAHALDQFHTPDELLTRLADPCGTDFSTQVAQDFKALNLRDYQIKAIKAVESQLRQNELHQWVMMAPGTGKTYTIFALIYRLLNAKRFKRILLLVDRTALGLQIINHFEKFDQQGGASLTALYQIHYLDDESNGAQLDDAGLTLASLDAVEKRIKNRPDDNNYFDCIIVDEFDHLNAPLMETLARHRRLASTFTRATWIGFSGGEDEQLSRFLNPPIFRYTFAEGVIDGWLIDHEPPTIYETKLSQSGIYFGAGATLDCYDNARHQVEQISLTEALHFSLAHFNERVMNESFNQVICEQLVTQEISPFSSEKTLIFCQDNRHADLLKRLLDEAFVGLYGEQYNHRLTAKITRESVEPDRLIERFRGSEWPNIAITVDLLTTEIEIPNLRNIVFMRHINSPIHYWRMIGRASRPSSTFNKGPFRIFDVMGTSDRESSINDARLKAIIDPHHTVISRHRDEWVATHQSFQQWGDADHYIQRFHAWIEAQRRENPTLAALIDDPRQITRREYDQLRLLAYRAGFSETYLQVAYQTTEHHSAEATLIGFIRHAFFGEPLIAFSDRLAEAMESVERHHPWNALQRDWLKAIERYLQQRVIIDQSDIDHFAQENGGYQRLDTLLERHLHDILLEIDHHLWPPLVLPEHLTAHQRSLDQPDHHELKEEAIEADLMADNGFQNMPYSLEKYRQIGLITLLLFGGLLLLGLVWSFV